MVEKTNFENSQAKKERFEFVLTVNGNIICQRYFRINNFKERSLGSLQLTDAVEDCVSVINKDLKEKSNIYLWYTAPQMFANRAEMDRWAANPTFKLDNPAFVVLNDTEEVFVWDGVKMSPYEKSFNTSDYVTNGKRAEEPACIFKFAFLDEGREVRSISWDGSVYPKFVRSNIDLSNSKNKYKADGVYAPMEEFLMDKFIASMEDVIPVIVKKICSACSKNDISRYERYENIGGLKYDMNIQGQIREYYRKYEADYRKKTEAYFAEV